MADHSFLKTNFPVDMPKFSELSLPKDQFDEHIRLLVGGTSCKDTVSTLPIVDKTQDHDQSVKAEMPMIVKSPFMETLLGSRNAVPSFDRRDGKTRTENGDVTYATSGEALVDCFYELEDSIDSERLRAVLQQAWCEDASATLKIIWNARSIHLGKSSRNTFYRAVGWLVETHPMTLLVNLPWLVRPLIQKKMPQMKDVEKEAAKSENREDAVMVDAEDSDSDFEHIEIDEPAPKTIPEAVKVDNSAELAEYDIKFGVAHGYWKDLLNILALAVNGELKVDGSPARILNTMKTQNSKRDWTRKTNNVTTADRLRRNAYKLKTDGFYKALYLTVARLFAEQLSIDLARLSSGKKSDLKQITLAAKWAPSHNGFHDKHTGVVSTIAELLYPIDSFGPEVVNLDDRILYLKHARLAYQTFTLSPLRKFLQVVERPITAGDFGTIKYERVPSQAMSQYTSLFIEKDYDHFSEYIEQVAKGQVRISGATLLPSKMVSKVRVSKPWGRQVAVASGKGNNGLVAQKTQELEDEIETKAMDGQWKALVQRIRDSGTLDSSIAVCDVSASMTFKVFQDQTMAMDSSIGLSLLIAEVTQPPFGGAFITFHDDPQIIRVGGVDDPRNFKEKVNAIEGAPWGGSTDFVAVFEDLILPLAIKHKLKQEDMVKQVFVFSDMQFNEADHRGRGSSNYASSHERIQGRFRDAGYEMPKLIFWNLHGKMGRNATMHDKGVTSKPVQANEENTALVSGYSQGQLKMFLDKGLFGDPPEEEIVEEAEGDEQEVVVLNKKTSTPKMTPRSTMEKAISHEAYRMLKVVD